MGVVQEVKDGKFVESNSAQSLAKDKSKVKNGSNLDKDAFLQLLGVGADAEYERDTGAFQSIYARRADCFDESYRQFRQTDHGTG